MRFLTHTDNKCVLAGQYSTAFTLLFLETGVTAAISKFKMTQRIAHLYPWGNNRQVGSAWAIIAILESPHISQIYYYLILHQQPAPPERDTFSGNTWINPWVSSGYKTSRETQRVQTQNPVSTMLSQAESSQLLCKGHSNMSALRLFSRRIV